jgi:hypothetical protein
MSSFALAYEDYVRLGLWDVSGYESGQFDLGPGTKEIIGAFANLADMRLGVVAGGRTIGGDGTSSHNVIASNVWDDSLDAGLPIQIVSLLDVRRAGDETDFLFTVAYLDDSGSWQDLTYEDPAYPSSDFLRHIHVILPAPVSACGVRVEVIQLGGDCSFTVGRLWAGPLWRPAFGIQTDWEMAILDSGEMGLSRGGQGYPRRRQRRRQLDVRLGHCTLDDAYGNAANTTLDLQQLGYRLGSTEPLIAFPRTRDSTDALDAHVIHRLGVYGHLVQPIRIRHSTGNYFNTALQVNELL